MVTINAKMSWLFAENNTSQRAEKWICTISQPSRLELPKVARLVDNNENRPEMVGSLSLAKSTSRNHADASFLQQFQAVEHVRGQ